MLRFDFQVTKESRLKYEIENSLFSIVGDLIIANFRQARILANKINTKRKSQGITDKLVTPGVINGIGLQHEIFHYVIRVYEETENKNVFQRAINKLTYELGEKELDRILLHFIADFPAPEVQSGKLSANLYLNSLTDNKPNKEIILEELLLLHIGNSNPAGKNLKELYDDTPLGQQTDYLQLIQNADKFFEKEKLLGNENLSLIKFLKRPIETNPQSLEGQLEFILKNWRIYIKSAFDDRLLRSKDLFAEDAQLFQIGGFHKGTPPVPDYDAEYLKKLRENLLAGRNLTDDERRYYYEEYEHFTSDIDWMPKVVMIAKNIFVWLDQLSKKYQRSITRLDQIPDEELNDLARWNFTALWLIGIWERSSASKKIKQMTGNPEAAASAYSLFDYVIAEELGGEGAFENLKHRAWERGIRLSSDMVPNHMGIFSKWMIERPDYFIQSGYPPYPNYTFNGVNLSDDPRVDVRIEDKYYSREDAAVAFQRKDNQTGDVTYIYHGNDGTSMPWNDTAQLNLLKPEVRESLIQTIMHVARKTPIIRFDAAMTLTKKHYARLWFPQPGTGGAIPSRSDYSLTRTEFDTVMPNEFWREVVDRINAEMPDTLLLAEAFWLMEGYFVRTLGMHRVYNSAFMHMMMKEENNKFRSLIKNTLEFNPEILKRYVNFMSNPDEETAINQFGDGDKYFGVAIMMITLPGLPMFGHGQIEGYKEKYGMEYKRAYYNETRNDNLVSRHEWEIFPLLQKRYLFSQVEHFELYDFFDDAGFINENVFAFSNRSGDERSLVIYNNSYNSCSGTISHSAMKVNPSQDGAFTSRKISEALWIKDHKKYFYIYRDHRTKLEYINSGEAASRNGLYFNLDGYQYYVLQDFREVYDHNGNYERLYYHLNRRGVQSIEQEMHEMNLAPVHQAFAALFDKEMLEKIDSYISGKETQLPEEINSEIFSTVNKVNGFADQSIETSEVIKGIHTDLRTFRSFEELNSKLLKKTTCPKWYKEAYLNFPFKKNGTSDKKILIQLILLHNIFQHSTLNNLFDLIDTYRILNSSFRTLGVSEDRIYSTIYLIKSLTGKEKYHLWAESLFTDPKPMQLSDKECKVIYVSDLFYGQDISEYLNINEYKGEKYFHKESFETLLDWLFLLLSAGYFKEKKKDEKTILSKIKAQYSFFSDIKIKAGKTGYNISKLKELLLGKNGKAKTQKGSVKKNAVKKKVVKPQK
jgi:glycosidase